ncbi:hypothetical protein [Bacillus anthracis]|uniref:hypothetical protein n=1 Tax=Bacillus anthracis TaxID=1392 RepID=UPI00211D4279|nr:hypothetical protein [Bacillus anthracis]
MKKEKVIDIRNGYSMEVDNIRTKLSELENGRIYEITGARMDGTIAKNIERLKEMLNDLCNKIEYGKDSMIEEITTLHETKDSK